MPGGRPIRPRGGGGPGNRRRRVVIDGGTGRPGAGQRQRPGDRADRQPKAPREVAPPTGPVTVESGISMRDFSQALGVPMPQIIKMLMDMGSMKTATQTLTDDEVGLIAAELGREVTIKHASDEDVEPESFDDADEELEPRPPVVTIMGHVDHGKTTLLDAVRKTAVVETEAGGITQHIGAYQTEIDGRKITFLDTPGHEAFTAMRARGAKVTDIAVLVVAADDSVMPQTLESISHARAAEVPIVVAVNKIDLAGANPDRVLADLAAQGLQPEEWGGTTQVAKVSAKQGTGLDDLLEKILLVADLELELTANPDAPASGPIIESRLDVGRGPVTTMLVQRGTLEVGDAIVAGDAWGRVRALYDYRGERVESAGPGEPVEILGFDKPPPAGELGRVVENDRRARDLAQQRGDGARVAAKQGKATRLEKIARRRPRARPAANDRRGVRADHRVEPRRRPRPGRRRCSSTGTLKVGDAGVAGDAGAACARCTTTAARRSRRRAGRPVEILGFDKPPPAGELARWSRTSAAPATSRSSAASACAASRSRSRRAAASRSRSCSSSCSPAVSPT